MADIQHVNITDPNLHEPKGAATATAGEALFSVGTEGATEFREIILADVSDLALPAASLGEVFVSDGLGSGSWTPHTPAAGTVSQGAYKYADTATAITPIALTLADVEYDLTNDGLGAETILDWPVPGLPNIWDTTTNRLDFTGAGDVLGLGDNLDILVELSLTTTAGDTAIQVYLDLDPDGTPFRLNLIEETNFKKAGTYEVDRFISFFMKSQAILDGGGALRIESDGIGASVEVRAFFVRAFHTNQ